MKPATKLMAVMCGAAAMAGCSSNQRLLETTVVPAMQIRHSHESAHGYYTLGRYYHGSRRFDEALKAYQQALDLAPEHMNARNAMAIIHASRGEYERAIFLLRDITQETSGTSYLFSNLGYIYLLKGDYEKAEAALRKATALDEGNVLAWNNLGNVIEKLGRRSSALMAFARARKLKEGGAALTASASVYPSNIASERDVSAGTGMVSQGATFSRPGAGIAMEERHARTELQETSAGVYEARIIPSVRSDDVLVSLAEGPVHTRGRAQRAKVRLEVSNGNGVPGMAKTVATSLGGRSVQVVRLTNQKHFRVLSTHIEYKKGFEQSAHALAQGFPQTVAVKPNTAGFGADVRIVLGRDLLDSKTARLKHLNDTAEKDRTTRS